MTIGEAGDGGQVFPCEQTIGYTSKHLIKGIVLRDYFAIKSLQSMISDGWPIGFEDSASTAAVAYAMADAMLAERAK